MPDGRICTRAGCADFDACYRAVNGWQGELSFCERDDMPKDRAIKPHTDWAQYEHLFGTMSDRKMAEIAGCPVSTIGYQRRKRNIPFYKMRWPDQLCGCGCGQITKRPSHTDEARGIVRGKPNKFLRYHRRP